MSDLENELLGNYFDLTQEQIDYIEEQNQITDEEAAEAAVGIQEGIFRDVTWGENKWADGGREGNGEVFSEDMTTEQLEEHFNNDHKGSMQLRETFGDFETYLDYMTQREQVLEDIGYENYTKNKQALLAQVDDKYYDIAQRSISGDVTEEERQWMMEYAAGNQDFLVNAMQNDWLQEQGMQELNESFGVVDEYTAEDGRHYTWNGSGWTKTGEPKKTNYFGALIKAGAGLAFGIASGGAAAGGLAGALGGTVSGAVGGIVGSAIGQAVSTGGDIDSDALLVAAITGGIGGLAGEMLNGSLTGTALDEAVWEMADLIGTDYESALNILTGVANGAIEGGELEDIALGAVGGIATNVGKDMIRDFFGDVVNVDDIFKDGQSHIPVEAFDPVLEGIVNAAINGGMDAEEALQMAWGYFSAGGDVDFLLPGFSDMVSDWDIDFPGIDFEKSDEWDLVVDPETGDVTIDWTLPDIDIDLPDLPDVVECMEGFDWDGQTCVKIPDIEIPDVVECMEGFDWDGQQCVEIPDFLPEGTDCEEGFNWDSLLGQCVEIDIDVPDVPKPECLEGESWSEFDQQCIPDILECMEGFEWDGQTCVEIPDIEVAPDGTDCEDGFNWDSLLGQCVEIQVDTPEGPEMPEGPEIDIECPEGWAAEDGTCIELPSIPTPEMPTANYTPYNMEWTGLFDYTNIDVYQGEKLAPMKDYIKQAKGMLS